MQDFYTSSAGNTSNASGFSPIKPSDASGPTTFTQHHFQLHSWWVTVRYGTGPLAGPGTPSATLKFSTECSSCSVPIRARSIRERVVEVEVVSSIQTTQITAQAVAVCGSTAS